VILDLNLPGACGLDVLREIRFKRPNFAGGYRDGRQHG